MKGSLPQLQGQVLSATVSIQAILRSLGEGRGGGAQLITLISNFINQQLIKKSLLTYPVSVLKVLDGKGYYCAHFKH